jgi:hypothetical protein
MRTMAMPFASSRSPLADVSAKPSGRMPLMSFGSTNDARTTLHVAPVSNSAATAFFEPTMAPTVMSAITAR